MASKSLSSLHGPYERSSQAMSSERAWSGHSSEHAGDRASLEGRSIDRGVKGPNDAASLLKFYFGDPTSSHDNEGTIRRSPW